MSMSKKELESVIDLANKYVERFLIPHRKAYRWAYKKVKRKNKKRKGMSNKVK